MNPTVKKYLVIAVVAVVAVKGYDWARAKYMK